MVDTTTGGNEHRSNKTYFAIALVIGIATIALVAMLFVSPLASLQEPRPLPSEYTTWVAKNITGCVHPYGVGQTTVASYFEDRGIQVYGQRSYSLSDGFVGCPDYTLYLEVEDSSVERMSNEFGFVSQMLQ